MSMPAGDTGGEGLLPLAGDAYLTLAPRGLETFASDLLRRTLTSNGYACEAVGVLGRRLPAGVGGGDSNLDGLDPIADRIDAYHRKRRRKMQERRRREIEFDVADAEAAAGSSRSSSGRSFRRRDYGKQRTENNTGADEDDHRQQQTPLHNDIEMDQDENENDNNKFGGAVDHHTTGTTTLRNGSSISLGYYRHDQLRIASVPGTMDGIVLIHFRTNAPATFVGTMKGVGCGPLLALVKSSAPAPRRDDGDGDETADGAAAGGEILDFTDSIETTLAAIAAMLRHGTGAGAGGAGRGGYASCFRSALRLWRDHASQLWFGLDADDHDDDDDENANARGESYYGVKKDVAAEKSKLLRRKAKGEIPHSYRVSTIRSHPKKYSYERRDLIPGLVDLLVPTNDLDCVGSEDLHNGATKENNASPSAAASDGCDSSRGTNNVKNTTCNWYVDLTNFDFNVVAIVHDNNVTIGIPLRPYQEIGAKSYGSSNTVPPDVTPPYYACSKNCGGSDNLIIRLRPSTAEMLIAVADLEPGSIVLDPCAGVGTLPVVAASHGHFGLGGEISADARGHAVEFLNASAAEGSISNTQHRGGGASSFQEMAGWDAMLLPLRDGCVDCVVSDLPFGQKCLSTKELAWFLPLLLYQCARVLVPGAGKMVLLCGGNFDVILDILKSVNVAAAAAAAAEATNRSPETTSAKNDDDGGGGGTDHPSAATAAVFALPCESVFPVNVGGFIAWVIVVYRGTVARPVAPEEDYRSIAKKATLYRNMGAKHTLLQKRADERRVHGKNIEWG